MEGLSGWFTFEYLISTSVISLRCLASISFVIFHLVQLYMTVRFRNTIHSYGRGSFNLSVKAIQALIGLENPHQPPNQSDAKLNL